MHKPTPIKDVLVALMNRDEIMSDNELARRSGLPQPTITRIRTGKTKDPETATIQALANYFKVTTSQMRGDQPLAGSAPSLDDLLDQLKKQMTEDEKRDLLRYGNFLIEQPKKNGNTN